MSIYEEISRKSRKANPELVIKQKKTIAMPDFLKEKWAKQKGVVING